MKKRQLSGQVLWRWIVRERLRLGVIVLTCLVAWSLASWLTPYHERPRAEFSVTTVPQPTYLRAEVTSVDRNEGKARVLDGPQAGQELPMRFYTVQPTVASTVLISSDTTYDEPNAVVQPWRLPTIILLVALMCVLVVAIGGRQGLMSIVGLGVSVVIILNYVIPTALHGGNALLASVIGAFAIATIAIAIAHSLRWRTAISLLSIYVALGVVIGLALLSGWLAALSGIYDETSSLLNMAGRSNLDMYGILLGGIIIASLGVLDDVVTTQVAAVDELRQAKPHASWRELFGRGMSVGREHLSALINTLALAYVGIAMPTILVLSQQITTHSQLLVTLNYEYIAVEIIRTVISSLGIILAIPLSTALAVVLIGKKQQIIGILKRGTSNSRR